MIISCGFHTDFRLLVQRGVNQGNPIFSGVAHHPLHFSLEWMGEKYRQHCLFAIPSREKIFIPISQNGDIHGLLFYIVASIAIAWLFKELLKRIPSPKIN